MEKVVFKHRQTSVIEKNKPQGQLRKEDFRKREEDVWRPQEETAWYVLVKKQQVSGEMGKKINERKVTELRDKDHSSQDFVSLGPWPSCS